MSRREPARPDEGTMDGAFTTRRSMATLHHVVRRSVEVAGTINHELVGNLQALCGIEVYASRAGRRMSVMVCCRAGLRFLQ